MHRVVSVVNVSQTMQRFVLLERFIRNGFVWRQRLEELTSAQPHVVAGVQESIL